MGAGHAYRIGKHMLVNPHDLTNYQEHNDFADKWQGEPVASQIKAMKESSLHWPESDDIMDDMSLVEISSNGSEHDSLDLKDWVEGFYADGLEESDAVDFLKESIVNSGIEAAKATGVLHFDGYLAEHIKRTGDIIVLAYGDHAGPLSESTFKVGLLADQYNTGVATFIQDAMGDDHIHSLEEEDLLNIVLAEATQSVDFHKFLEYRQAPDAVALDEVFINMHEYMDDGELEYLVGDHQEDLVRLAEMLNEDEEHDFAETNPAKLEEIDRLKCIVSKQVVSQLDSAISDVQSTFDDFSNKVMDNLINQYPDNTFYYATSAWTGAPYKKGDVLFSGPVDKPEPTPSESPTP